MDGEFIGGQLKAARKLKGVRTTRVLARRINRARFGEKVIGQIERDERPAQEHEIAWLADTLGVPVSYLTDPVEADPEPDPDERIAAMEARLMDQAEIIRDLLKTQNGLLARQSGVLERIEKLIRREEQAKTETEEATRRLLAASETAHQALRLATQSPEPAPDKQAT